MRDIFINVGALLLSKFFKDLPKKAPEKSDRVLKSLRIEDEIYRETRAGNDAALHALEDRMAGKLPTFRALSRDVFQSFYTMNVQSNAENDLTPMARKFNRHIIKQMMESTDYPTIKSICEGRELPSIEATQKYMEHIAAHLDELMDAANGDRHTLDTLEKQAAQQDRGLDELQNLVDQWEKNSAADPALEKKILQIANRLYSKVRQLETMSRMVDDNLLKSGGQVRPVLLEAGQAAKEKAIEVWQTLLSWGSDPALRCASFWHQTKMTYAAPATGASHGVWAVPPPHEPHPNKQLPQSKAKTEIVLDAQNPDGKGHTGEGH